MHMRVAHKATRSHIAHSWVANRLFLKRRRKKKKKKRKALMLSLTRLAPKDLQSRC